MSPAQGPLRIDFAPLVGGRRFIHSKPVWMPFTEFISVMLHRTINWLHSIALGDAAMNLKAHPVGLQLRRLVHQSGLLQVGLLILFWLAGEVLVQAAHLPVPGAVAGLALVLVLLAAQRLRPGSVRRGAQWLLGDMLLFFVPAVLAVMNHRELLGVIGLKLLTVIVLGTAAVMAVTALTVELCMRSRAHGAGKPLG